MFSLEQLSKIRWAEEDSSILDFFAVLDEKISSSALDSQSKSSYLTVDISQLRDDEVHICEDVEQIIEGFPQVEGKHLKIPKVI